MTDAIDELFRLLDMAGARVMLCGRPVTKEEVRALAGRRVDALLLTGTRSPVCLDCGHPLTEADRDKPVCPYCGVA